MKQKILEANQAYRDGHPIMSDEEFDELCEQYQKTIPLDEWLAFRNTLHEKEGKVKHPFVMGSLAKIKLDDDKGLMGMVVKTSSYVNVSAKVDGISCRLQYANGKLVSASTRGDGYYGVPLDDKIQYIKGIPKTIPSFYKGELNIRGELVILKQDFEALPDFANPRNATAGIMNQKEPDPFFLQNVSFIAYTILGKAYNKRMQFQILEKLGFTTAWHKDVCLPYDAKKIRETLTIAMDTTLNLDYETDGLVVSFMNYVNEDKYIPDTQFAVKGNRLRANTRVVDISWEGPSKDGRFVPVAILEPVAIGGTIVSKASLHNAAFLMSSNVQYGSLVEICKRGDIIPQIERIIEDA